MEGVKNKSDSEEVLRNGNGETSGSTSSTPTTSRRSFTKKIRHGLRSRSLFKKRKEERTGLNSSRDSDKKALVPFVQHNFFNLSQKIKLTLVLIEARDLPIPDDGSQHKIFCKITLGAEKQTSNTITCSPQTRKSPFIWGQRFNFWLKQERVLKFSFWDQSRQLNSMGSTDFDFSTLQWERTHVISLKLDNGFGKIYFSVTICDLSKQSQQQNNSLEVVQRRNVNNNMMPVGEWLKNSLTGDWKVVGELQVTVLEAKGLAGNASAYCTLEVDNQRVQTSSINSTNPQWNKSFTFNVYDITSTLDLKIYDSSFLKALRIESLGRVSIPLLDIKNGEARWIGLKNKSKRESAPGNYPRIQLEMNLTWNVVKATARLFRPREGAHVRKAPKFDMLLVYRNTKFIRDTFDALFLLNENIKELFEWENRELCFTSLVAWLLFWYFFRMWATPLLLLIPFLYFWFTQSNEPLQRYCVTGPYIQDDATENSDSEKTPEASNFISQLMIDRGELADMTWSVTKGVEYLVSTSERLFNLATFKVPYLSILAMIFLLISAFAFYFIPINYTMMAFGIYKFTRKLINPNRILNNDVLDFLSRVPDNNTLKDWKEVDIPEPNRKVTLHRSTSI